VAQLPADLTPFVSARHFFGAELRHWRRLRGMSLASLGQSVHVAGDLIGKIEKAQRWPHVDLVQRCDAALDSDGVLSRLYGLAEHERRRSTTSDQEHDPPARAQAALPFVIVVLPHAAEEMRPELYTQSAKAGTAWAASGSDAGDDMDNIVNLAVVRGRDGHPRRHAGRR
jgi:transcriptional regulator with XRE-family HTH domain